MKNRLDLFQGRHISNNIRLILDMWIIMNTYQIILFVDFHKAFDTIETRSLFKPIDFFGFGKYFLKLLKRYTRDALVL